MNSGRLAWAAAWVSLVLGMSPADVIRLSPSQEPSRSIAATFQRRHVSLGPARRNVLATRKARGPAAPLRVLAIRADFPPPRESDGCGVSGDGTFDLSGEDTEGRDPGAPPHNKQYFERQLEALNRYYQVQSYGAVNLEYRVVPDRPTSAYRMPERMAYYSYYRDPSDLGKREERLVKFFTDAIKAADADSSVRMGDYDCFIVFHAGGDWQHDYAGDSPCDLITAYIPSITAFTDEPISVDEGAYSVDDGIVMPEGLGQDLDPSEEIASIQSELAHEFGHQLGLLDLYDYNYWSNVVGYWALMDNGDGVPFQDETGRIITGVLPPSLCAFSKVRLGWGQPLELVQEGTYSVSATTMAPSVFKATITYDEFFLVENRETDTDGDPAVYLKSVGGIILGPTTSTGDTTTSEYDAGLPGSGLLIWHQDNSVGAWNVGLPNYNEYDASADTLIKHWGLALEEADGIENIGIQAWETAGMPAGTEPVDPRGGPDDPFRQGNNTSFGDATKPSSWDNRGRRTHIEIRNISAAGPEMTFEFARTWQQDGWPVDVAVGPLTAPNIVTTEEGEILITVGGAEMVHVYNSLGQRLGVFDSRQKLIGPSAVYSSGPEGAWIIAISGEAGSLGLFSLPAPGIGEPLEGWPLSLTDKTLSSPVLDDLDGDGVVEVTVGSKTGALYLLSEDGSAMPGWPLQLGAGDVGSPAVADIDADGTDELVVVVAEEGVYALSMAGEILPGWPVLEGGGSFSDPLLADCDGDGEVEIFVVSGKSAWLFSGGAQILEGWPVEADTELSHSTAILDIDGDGLLDFATLSRGGRVCAWSIGGRLVADCFGHGLDEPLLAEETFLLSMDTNDDQETGFLLGAGEELDAFESSGQRLPGWPMSAEGITGGLLVDMDDDGDIELVFADSSGTLNVWDLPYATSDTGWYLPRGDNSLTGWAGVGLLKSWDDPSVASAAEFYCWPSPVTGERAHFSFRAQQGASVILTILDAAGHRRDEWKGNASGQRDEWVWSVAVPSGVYLCRLEARATGQTQTMFHTFSVKR